MIIALFVNISKPLAISVSKKISYFFKDNKILVVSPDEYAQQINSTPLSSINKDDLFCSIVLGGDGTILRTVKNYPHITAPLLGINLGFLGFMAEILLENLFIALSDLLNNKFSIEERLLMEGSLKDTKFIAVNEIVIHRGENPNLIDLTINIDNKYLNTFSADGIIFSTPSGSTAYSLAAGGPILTPELPVFVITPISPHTISNRSIVVMPKKSITVQYIGCNKPVNVSHDGFSVSKLKLNESVSIIKSKKTLKMISLNNSDYFSILRSKLGWAKQIKDSQLNYPAEERE